MEGHSLLIGVSTIVVLGVGANWIAWRLRFPSILLMLILGTIAGPVTGFLQPDALFGEVLFPIVSLFVAIILFEGGLNLELSELRERGRTIHALLLIGNLVSWTLATAAAYILLGFDLPIATLQGAILVVTGPTVIIPLLQHIRPSDQISSIARWEGIMKDPIGAILAVIVFEAIRTGSFGIAGGFGIIQLIEALLIGTSIGAVGAFAMIEPLRRYWIPDYLRNSVILMTVLAVFTVSDSLQAESGLLAVTIMGIILANQSTVRVKHLIAFKEDLRVLLISSLFIILAARLDPADLHAINWRMGAFLGALVLVVRPLAVGLSTIGSDLSTGEKTFLAWLAPRGIVAAAISALFAERLVEAGYPAAEQLVPVTFFVIAGTVALYGLTAAPLAYRLGLATRNPQGVLMIGAHQWARTIAGVLQSEGYSVRLVDANAARTQQARAENLDAVTLDILSESDVEHLNLEGMGHMLTLTPNDEVNSLAVLHTLELFDRSEVYQLTPHKYLQQNRQTSIPKHLRGRLLFEEPVTYRGLDERFTAGATLQTIPLTEEYTYEDFTDEYGDRALSMFLIDPSGPLHIFNTRSTLNPSPGQKLIALIGSDLPGGSPGENEPKTGQLVNANQ
jgi:NhaP-type Na+/H+ or K+/H+ antiporter